jgi:hypothetical protein
LAGPTNSTHNTPTKNLRLQQIRQSLLIPYSPGWRN